MKRHDRSSSPPDKGRQSKDPAPSKKSGDEIEQQLRDAYRDVVQAPIPTRLLSLLKRIERKDRDP